MKGLKLTGDYPLSLVITRFKFKYTISKNINLKFMVEVCEKYMKLTKNERRNSCSLIDSQGLLNREPYFPYLCRSKLYS
jgi:hypothetical protein